QLDEAARLLDALDHGESIPEA
ncbi:DUF523 domain-containing protein, partial [Ralstonia pseudosolanacearum]